MIISKTPFRISFFGGGTDYPVWFEEHGGAVLSTTIDKYCYISIRYLPPFFTHKHRIVYSNIENVKSIDEIQHPSVKALLRQFNIEKGLEIHHDGDLPARSGLGSSSAFTVGMLNALYALKGRIISKYELAKQAIDVERNVLKEIVGSQDQVAVACGGFNKITFNKDHTFRTEPMTLQKERIIELEQHLMLIFTGFSRFASEIAAEQIKNTMDRKKELSSMKEMVDHAIEILNSCQDIAEFGKLLHESWQLKKCLSNKISNKVVDDLYVQAIKHGALGGKLLGAGGGGFMLLFVRPENREKLKQGLKDYLEVKFSFDNEGSQIIYYNP
ncbi:MAG: kinase [Candidatus Omnitrophica bacterium CG1_02_44_16]|nr:MAG: kinase [Candidatus Omnitrophica bacterium CG1_02_44_16]PIY83015.1 MAG: kinase [Candidatus Omnitrophica bacterium CG_4_10_14_0_8_um_filter_44_12]